MRDENEMIYERSLENCLHSDFMASRFTTTPLSLLLNFFKAKYFSLENFLTKNEKFLMQEEKFFLIEIH